MGCLLGVLTHSDKPEAKVLARKLLRATKTRDLLNFVPAEADIIRWANQYSPQIGKDILLRQLGEADDIAPNFPDRYVNVTDRRALADLAVFCG